MKKRKNPLIKKGVCLLTAIFLMISLTSCIELKDLKASHGVWEAEYGGPILINGARYVRVNLPTNNDYYNWATAGYITEADVPALLAVFYGRPYYWRDLQGDVILVDSTYTNNCYVREDRKEEILETYMRQDDGSYICEVAEHPGEPEHRNTSYRLSESKITAIQKLLVDVKEIENASYWEMIDEAVETYHVSIKKSISFTSRVEALFSIEFYQTDRMIAFLFENETSKQYRIPDAVVEELWSSLCDVIY